MHARRSRAATPTAPCGPLTALLVLAGGPDHLCRRPAGRHGVSSSTHGSSEPAAAVAAAAPALSSALGVHLCWVSTAAGPSRPPWLPLLLRPSSGAAPASLRTPSARDSSAEAALTLTSSTSGRAVRADAMGDGARAGWVCRASSGDSQRAGKANARCRCYRACSCLSLMALPLATLPPRCRQRRTWRGRKLTQGKGMASESTAGRRRMGGAITRHWTVRGRRRGAAVRGAGRE